MQFLDVNSYVGDPKGTITLAAQFSSLPDGTNYVSQTVLNAQAKQITVTTTNGQYSKLTP